MNKHNTVFILDDDEGYIDIVSTILQSNGYKVLKNSEGNMQALMQHCLPDLVLLDCNLGSKSGVEICRLFKANPATFHIPVILVSGECNICELAQLSQANDFLAKPFDLSQLLHKVHQNLHPINFPVYSR